MDGIIALGVFSEKGDRLSPLSLSFAIVFVNSNQHNYEFDQVQVDFDRGQEQMVSILLDQKRYTGLGIYRRHLRRGQWPHRCPPPGSHPAHPGEAAASTIPAPSMWGRSAGRAAMHWPRRPWRNIPG